MVKIVLKCIVLYIFAFLCNNFYCDILGTSDTYLYSNENIAFMLFISIILSIKYDILKRIIQINNKNVKRFATLGFVLLFFVVINYIYVSIPTKYNVQEWWNELSFRGLVFLPENYKHLNIALITGVDLIFSTILIFLEFAREEIIENKSKQLIGNRAKKAYALEKIVKFYFRYNFPTIFIMNLLMIPRKYVIAAKLANFGIIILIISHIILAIYIIESLYMYSEKDKSKCGKEKLIIILTMQNYKLCFYNKFKGLLYEINKLYSKNIFNDLFISSKDCTFVNYDAIRYNLIDRKQYKNISYFIILKDGILNGGTCGFRRTEFNKKIEQIAETTDNFIIYSKLKRIQHIKFSKEITEKYKYKMIKKLSIEKLVNAFGQNKKDECKEYFNYETEKYKTLGSKTICNLNHRWSENEVKKMAEKMG